MTGIEILLSLLKIVVVILFLITTTAVLTWAERRQSAMIQDRMGPNRAVIYLPGGVVKALLAGGGVLVALAVLGFAFVQKHPEGAKLGIGGGLFQLGVLVTWLSLLVIRVFIGREGAQGGFEEGLAKIEDPRSIFYSGLLGHALVLVASIVLGSGEAPENAGAAVLRAGAVLLALMLVGSGLWAASKIGPGKVGLRLAGLLHPVADGAKFVFKEDFVPPNADKLLHALGPIISLFPALVTFAVIPFGDTLCVRFGDGGFWNGLLHGHIANVVSRNGICAERGVSLQIADLNVGILYMFALAGTGIIGAAIAGWSSDNKYSLLGGLRAASQMVSYEVGLGMSLIGAFMIYGTVRLDDMVRWQGEHAWGIFVQPAAFFLFLASSVAEQKRTPFDAPEGESEIVAGYFVEYSGMKFGMFYLGEYMEVVTSSAVLVTIFFGGWNLPFLHRDGVTLAFGDTVLFQAKMAHLAVVLIGALTFFAKVLIVCWAQLFIRWTVPRFRYDQIMKLGWRKLLPASIVNMLVTGLAILAIDAGGPSVDSALRIVGDVTQGVLLVGGAALVVWLVSALLKPTIKQKYLGSSAAKFADAQGGVKATPMQA